MQIWYKEFHSDKFDPIFHKKVKGQKHLTEMSNCISRSAYILHIYNGLIWYYMHYTTKQRMYVG